MCECFVKRLNINKMYLQRKIDKFLVEWRNAPDRKPVIVRGARQIGKTKSVEHFAKRSYEHVIQINFASDKEYHTITKDGYGANAVIKNISLLNPDAVFVEGKTLIFFDEIQAFPDIATTLKFFKQDGRYDVICSGSLLGINYQQIESNSVGYKVDYNMASMDFEEFLWAKGYPESIADDMLRHLVDREPFSLTEQQVFMSLFRDYCVTGGMPEVVCNYVERGTFEGTLYALRQLVQDYKEDVRKYAIGLEQSRIINVFESIPVQLGKDNNKFQISKVASGARTRDYWGCIEWLRDAGIINMCYCLNFPELPLKGNYDAAKYKLYFADTGLLIAMLDEEVQEGLLRNQNLGTYKGAIYENIVAEALTKAGAGLFYYKRQDSTLEEDFFMRTINNLVPIEVKSRNGTSKSLRTLIESGKYSDISWGIKLVDGNIGYANNIMTIPYYSAFLLKRFLKTQ